MKKYTQEEFDALPRENGIKSCPTGDYSLVSSFGEGCSFGKGCSFGEWCSFGKWCSFGEGCKYINFVFTSVICLYGLYKHPVIIYRSEKEYILSVGCHNFKTIAEAVKFGKENDCYCEVTHRVVATILGVEGPGGEIHEV